MKQRLIITFIWVVFFLTHASFSFAQTPAAGNAESTDEAVIQENLKQRLKKVIDEKQDQIRGVVNSIARKRGVIGVVERVSEETLNVKTKKGNLIISFSPDLKIVQNNRPLNKSDIEIENEVVIVGQQQQSDFSPTHLYVSKTTLQPTPRTIVVGNVVAVDRRSITIKPRTSEERTFSFDTKTTMVDGQNDDLSYSDIETDQDVLLIVSSEQPTPAARATTPPSSGRVIVLRSLAVSKVTGQE